MRNITIRDSRLDGTNLAVRIKTCRGRGGGVEDVLYASLAMLFFPKGRGACRRRPPTACTDPRARRDASRAEASPMPFSDSV